MSKPHFQPLAANASDLNAALAELGVPALTRSPSPPEPALLQPKVEPIAAVPPRLPSAGAARLHIELPDYALEELKIRAARSRSSVRHIVLMGLRSIGVAIAEADMAGDRRRSRR